MTPILIGEADDVWVCTVCKDKFFGEEAKAQERAKLRCSTHTGTPTRKLQCRFERYRK